MLYQDSDRVRLLHVSDLHFVQKLTEPGSRLRRLPVLTKSHSFEKLEALINIMTFLRNGGRSFDHLVVTGDVSTDGARDSLQTARTFIEADQIRDLDANEL